LRRQTPDNIENGPLRPKHITICPKKCSKYTRYTYTIFKGISCFVHKTFCESTFHEMEKHFIAGFYTNQKNILK
jgi:hypothetical protein